MRLRKECEKVDITFTQYGQNSNLKDMTFFLLCATASCNCEHRSNLAACLHPRSPYAYSSVHSKETNLSRAPKPHGASQFTWRCSRLGIKAQMPGGIKFSYMDSTIACPYVQAHHRWKLPKPSFKNLRCTILLPVPFPCPFPI